jgi:hypothetical protein
MLLVLLMLRLLLPPPRMALRFPLLHFPLLLPQPR